MDPRFACKDDNLKTYEEILNILRNYFTEDQIMWFIWTKVANIVKNVKNHGLQCDLQGSLMSYFEWNHDLPYWCWDFIVVVNRESHDAEVQYDNLIRDFAEAGTMRNIGYEWKKIIQNNDVEEMIKIAEALDKIALGMIPAVVNHTCFNDLWDGCLNDKDKEKIKKAAVKEQKKSIKLASLIRESVSCF